VVTVTNPPKSPRTELRRLPDKASADLADLHAVLDAGRVAHVAFATDEGIFNIPVAYARDGDRLLIHGSTGSRLFRTLASGTTATVSVTLLHGLVLARSAFESSMQYRSAMVFGSPSLVSEDQMLTALRAMVDTWMPSRWDDLRPPTKRELAATMVLELPLLEWSVKLSMRDPEDPPEDLDEPVWAGVLPIERRYGNPIPAPDLRDDHEVPRYLGDWSI